MLEIIASLCGWGYLAAWGCCFFPQMRLNYQRKSVVGMSFDIPLYNVVGFACYLGYNAWTYMLQVQHGLPDAVKVQDLVYACHALTCSLILLAQCCCYERGGQSVTPTALACTLMLLVFLVLQVRRAAMGYTPWYLVAEPMLAQDVLPQNIVDAAVAERSSLGIPVFAVAADLTFVQSLGYVKVFINLVKYPSQIFLNMRMKSTAGMAISTYMLDLTGGVLSFGQNVVSAIDSGDVHQLSGNLPKLALSALAAVYDAILLIQHFVIYRPNRRYGRVAVLDSGHDKSAADKSPALGPVVAEPEFNDHCTAIGHRRTPWRFLKTGDDDCLGHSPARRSTSECGERKFFQVLGRNFVCTDA
eukprot:TRINITY_DN101430_c0_g1_i1.p1 TRINITY_DN101430_c0_g1~~TRINITY_DN101430_c0_g1_i1.p1  ORF type:complete len:358 (-),score=53.92 TRINITY_DN101430_c0_g1_i1:22-1095(-)